MKIALITEHFYPYIGGIAEHTFYLAQALAKKHEVSVISPIYPKVKFVPLPERPTFEIIRIGKASLFPANGSLTAFTYTPSSILKLKSLFQSEGFDIIHIQGSLVPTLPLFSAIIKANSKKVITFHSYHGKSMGYTLFKPFLKNFLSNLNGYIAVSVAAQSTIKKHFGIKNIEIIPNGVDIKRFNPYGAKFSDFEDGKFNILFVGRLEKRKGIPILFKALSKVKDKDLRLIVVGTGPLFKKYKDKIDKLHIEVQFLGKVSPMKLPSLYRTSHLFIAPSIKGESFGIVLLEAMASGIPVIASNIVGYAETLKQGKYGILFENKDPDDLRKKILRIYKDESLRKKLSEKGAIYVRNNYAWDIIATKTEEFYRSLNQSDVSLSRTAEIFKYPDDY